MIEWRLAVGQVAHVHLAFFMTPRIALSHFHRTCVICISNNFFILYN